MADSARITEIKLKNFKLFQDATFSRLSGFNVVVGANGVGKTTFFDVFGFLSKKGLFYYFESLVDRYICEK